MVFDVFGQEKQCLLEMEIPFTLLNSSQKISQKELFLMENYFWAEASFKKQCQLFDDKTKTTTGKTSNTSFSTAQSSKEIFPLG